MVKGKGELRCVGNESTNKTLLRQKGWRGGGATFSLKSNVARSGEMRSTHLQRNVATTGNERRCLVRAVGKVATQSPKEARRERQKNHQQGTSKSERGNTGSKTYTTKIGGGDCNLPRLEETRRKKTSTLSGRKYRLRRQQEPTNLRQRIPPGGAPCAIKHTEKDK